MDTQLNRAYRVLKKAGSRGVKNYEFASQGFLRYSHYVKELRADGHHITAERLKLPNGRWSNVWLYRLEDDE